MRIMAIDYGDARTGVALSDPTGFLAGQTFLIKSRKEDVVLEELAALAQKQGAEELVMGYPRNMDGTLGPRAEKYAAFAERLKERTGLPLTLWDERRTTVDAHRILGAQGVRAKNRKDKIDSVAATLILEGFLDWKRLQAQREKEELIKSRKEDVVLEELAALAQKQGAEELVMGYPRNMDGTLGPRAEKYAAFAERLKERTGLPLTLWDERRTTVDAHRILGAQGVRAKNRKDKIDSVAATLILEGFLDWKRLQAQREKEEQA